MGNNAGNGGGKRTGEEGCPGKRLISNASDAIDKLCYLSLTDDKVGMKRDDFEIRLTLDKENRNLTVSDNGIGMDAADLENNLGIIANSCSMTGS